MSARELLDVGWTHIELDDLECELFNEVFLTAEAFFRRPDQVKRAFALPGELEGYRDLGAEFSAAPDRPDLNEAFASVFMNLCRTAEMGWPRDNSLHAALRKVHSVLAPKVNVLFETLRRLIEPTGDTLVTSDWSYLQVNHYRPALETRDLLQDAHEDGHLITVVSSDRPGLEIEVGGTFRPIIPQNDRLLVMPGSILSLLTGARVPPLRHRVTRIGSCDSRTSIMYFVNPSLERPPGAWLPDVNGTYPDIRRAALDASTRFGLPVLNEAVKDR